MSDKRFSMSMFVNSEDLYKAKAEYFENKCKQLEVDKKRLQDDLQKLDNETPV